MDNPNIKMLMTQKIKTRIAPKIKDADSPKEYKDADYDFSLMSCPKP